ncbi:MAG TPA: kynureninase [Candidatus Dormibacteraeota bacterium]
MVKPPAPTRADCLALDAADSLGHLRAGFDLPPDVVYLDGNSLGPPPRLAHERVSAMLRREWGGGLVRSWNDAAWIEAPRRVGEKLGRLIGAAPGEVVVADSTSVNVFKLLAAALELRPARRVILMREDDFPTDRYIAQGLAAMVGAELRCVAAADLEAALGSDVAVVCVSHVDYRTGEMLDMPRLTATAQGHGVLAMWDLCHSAGAVPLDLGGADVDLAVGCGYKYLNGGPGAPAFCMVASRHHERLRQPLSGWMGHAAPFAFEAGYRPAEGVDRLLSGTPPMLALAALEAGIDAWAGVDMAVVRAKSIALGELCMTLVDARCAGLGVEVVTPRDPVRRGSQVSLRLAFGGYAVCRALIARGVIGDFRPPDILRLGLTPLYLRFVDVFDAVEALHEVLVTQAWRRPEYAVRAAVT